MVCPPVCAAFFYDDYYDGDCDDDYFYDYYDYYSGDYDYDYAARVLALVDWLSGAWGRGLGHCA